MDNRLIDGSKDGMNRQYQEDIAQLKEIELDKKAREMFAEMCLDEIEVRENSFSEFFLCVVYVNPITRVRTYSETRFDKTMSIGQAGDVLKMFGHSQNNLIGSIKDYLRKKDASN